MRFLLGLFYTSKGSLPMYETGNGSEETRKYRVKLLPKCLL